MVLVVAIVTLDKIFLVFANAIAEGGNVRVVTIRSLTDGDPSEADNHTAMASGAGAP